MNQVRDRFSTGAGMKSQDSMQGQIQGQTLEPMCSLGFEDRTVVTGLSPAARASMVNRTHRVVRERAQTMNARRSLFRSLWLPMLVCSSMLVILCHTVWTLLANYEPVPSGMPESGGQSFVLLLWFFPISATLLLAVWIRRARGSHEDLPR